MLGTAVTVHGWRGEHLRRLAWCPATGGDSPVAVPELPERQTELMLRDLRPEGSAQARLRELVESLQPTHQACSLPVAAHTTQFKER